MKDSIETIKANKDQSCVAARLAALKSPTKPSLKLIEMANEIQANELGNLGFFVPFLIQCTLPHTNPGNVVAWTRKNGAYTLVIQPGWDFEKERLLGYPYGTLPRLLLIWIITEAKRTGSRRLDLNDSLKAFLKELNLSPETGRGKRGDAKRFKEQAKSLFSSRIVFRRGLEKVNFQTGTTIATGEHTLASQVTHETMLWWDRGANTLSADETNWIELSTDFFAAIMASVVPCDMRGIALLQRSPLAIDLYMLCNWLAANMRGKTKHLLTWRMLAQQLGCDYAEESNLKKKVKAAMRKVQLAHPKLKFCYPAEGGGIEILASPPAIPRTRLPRDPA